MPVQSGPGEDSRRMKQIALRLGIELSALELVTAGLEAGLDVGQVFYSATLKGIKLAIRHDCMRAYVTKLDPKIKSSDQLAAMLRAHNLVFTDPPSVKQAKPTERPSNWIPAADGVSPTGSQWTEYFDPGRAGTAVPVHTLDLISRRLSETLAADALDEEDVATCPALRALPGDLLACVRKDGGGGNGSDIFGQQLEGEPSFPNQPKAGAGVTIDGDEFRALRYGYISLRNNTLSVLSPVWVDSAATQVCWCCLDPGPHEVEPEHIETWLAECQIVEGIQPGAIDRIIEQLSLGSSGRTLVEIARGQPAVNGRDSEVEVFVDLERKPGTMSADGSIDFHEVNFAPNVESGDLLGRVIPPSNGVDGFDVRGNVLQATDGLENQVVARKNVSQQDSGGETIFVATGAGLLRLANNKISVVQVLTIDGDVDFSTGNLDFSGEVFVKGSIIASFSVKADGNVTVAGTVEAGSLVVSNGNVEVGRGIVGRKARAVAAGSLRAQFVEESTAASGGDMKLGSHALHARLQSGGLPGIDSGEGRLRGTLMGGQAWGLKGIKLSTAGSPNSTRTVLIVGVDPDQAKELDALQRQIEECNGHIVRHLQRFNIDRVDVSQIKKILDASTGPRRGILARSARQTLQISQKLLLRQEAIEKNLAKEQERADIKALDKVFPGVEVRLGNSQRRIDTQLGTARIYLKDGEIVFHLPRTEEHSAVSS